MSGETTREYNQDKRRCRYMMDEDEEDGDMLK